MDFDKIIVMKEVYNLKRIEEEIFEMIRNHPSIHLKAIFLSNILQRVCLKENIVSRFHLWSINPYLITVLPSNGL